MHKIIAAFDGFKYAKSNRDYAIYLAKQASAHLVGVFLDDENYTNYKIYDLVVDDGVTERQLSKFENSDKALRHASAEDFEETCRQSKIAFTIHHDHQLAIHDLLFETIYADLLVINARENFRHHAEEIPSAFIHDLLKDAQCPLFITPDIYRPIRKIILLYDGSPSSVEAIKMFSYVFPKMKHLETEVLTVKNADTSPNLPETRLMKEFLTRHFPEATYTVLKGHPEDEIVKYLQLEESNAIVVLGAYRKSRTSRWFKKSMVDTVLKNTKFPLFIAHNHSI